VARDQEPALASHVGFQSHLLDAALIAAAQAVEHYEMTRYGTLIAWASQLGRNDFVSLGAATSVPKSFCISRAPSRCSAVEHE